MNDARSEVRSKWKLLLALHLAAAFGIATVLSYMIGSVVEPLSREFGWTRQQIGIGSSIMAAGIFPISFVVGALADRVGVRPLLITSQVGLALCFFAFSQMTALWQFYAIFALLPIMAGGTLIITVTKTVNAEFTRQRGLALGLCLAGTGVCGLTVPVLAGLLVTQFGWRAAFLGSGLLPLLLAAPASVAWLRETRQSPAGTPHAGALAGSDSDPTFGEALRNYRFHVVALAFFSGTAAVVGFLTSLVPVLREAGFPSFRAAATVSIFGVSVLLGRLFTGLLLDRYRAPLVTMSLCLPAALGLLLWPSSSIDMRTAFVFLVGLATGSEYDVSSYLIARHFGLRHYGKIYAGIYAAIAAGGVVAPIVYGWAYDTHGSYSFALYFSSFGFALCGLLPLLLGMRHPHVASSPTLAAAKLP